MHINNFNYYFDCFVFGCASSVRLEFDMHFKLSTSIKVLSRTLLLLLHLLGCSVDHVARGVQINLCEVVA